MVPVGCQAITWANVDQDKCLIPYGITKPQWFGSLYHQAISWHNLAKIQLSGWVIKFNGFSQTSDIEVHVKIPLVLCSLPWVQVSYLLYDMIFLVTQYSSRWISARLAVTPVLMHWSYCSLALSHQSMILISPDHNELKKSSMSRVNIIC